MSRAKSMAGIYGQKTGDQPMKHHPEQREDEIYMGNTTEERFKECGWRTKRLGETAQMADGSLVDQERAESYKPYFIKRSEVEADILIANDEIKQIYRRMLNNGRASSEDF